MAVHQPAAAHHAQPLASSKTESPMTNTMNSGQSTHNQAEMTANNFGQADCPDSQMNGQEPYQEDSLELSASPTPNLTSCEMPAYQTPGLNDSTYQMADASCPSSQHLVPTPNLIAPVTTQAATPLCDQTLSAFADRPQLPPQGSAQLRGEQQSHPMSGSGFARSL